MDTNSIIIISGLLALLVTYAAVRDSEGGWTGTVGPMHWSWSVSWSSSTAVVLALVLTLFSMVRDGTVLGLGLLMVLAPLIYRGIGASGGAQKVAFFIVSSLMTWATFAILYLAAITVPSLIEPLSLVPTIIIDTALVLALVGTVMHSARSLATATSGDGETAWTLP